MKYLLALVIALFLVVNSNAQDKTLIDYIGEKIESDSELDFFIPKAKRGYFWLNKVEGLYQYIHKEENYPFSVLIGAYKKKEEEHQEIFSIDVNFNTTRLLEPKFKSMLPYGIKLGMTSEEVYALLENEKGIENLTWQTNPDEWNLGSIEFLIVDRSPFAETKGIKVVLDFGPTEKEKQHKEKEDEYLKKYEELEKEGLSYKAEKLKGPKRPKNIKYKKKPFESISLYHPDLRSVLDKL